MASKFKVGRMYEAADGGLDPITVIGRTDKTIKVKNDCAKWRMKLRTDKNGDEYVVDSSVPVAYRPAYTYEARWVVRHTYYTLYRPPMPGAVPREGLQTAQVFDSPKMIEQIGHTALGTVVYDRMLTDEEIADYELVPT